MARSCYSAVIAVTAKAARLKTDDTSRLGRNGLIGLRRIFPQKALQILLHRIRQRDRIAHVVDRAVEAEAHHAREFGLAVWLGQQEHTLAETPARLECAERVARGVEHPDRPAQFGDLLRELAAVHGA